MNLITLIAHALLLTVQHPTMPQGTSHDEHMKQMEKDEALKRRGAAAMGFSQDATTHRFRLTPTGGSIEVTVNDEQEAATVVQVRDHLKTIAAEFGRGDFARPLRTHAEVPPGVAVMQEHTELVEYLYTDLPRGGSVQIRTDEARTLRAVHEFLRYQIIEHRTGDPLER